jgi:hypothetical protein
MDGLIFFSVIKSPLDILIIIFNDRDPLKENIREINWFKYETIFLICFIGIFQ